jgi:hypothetical protein
VPDKDSRFFDGDREIPSYAISGALWNASMIAWSKANGDVFAKTC